MLEDTPNDLTPLAIARSEVCDGLGSRHPLVFLNAPAMPQPEAYIERYTRIDMNRIRYEFTEIEGVGRYTDPRKPGVTRTPAGAAPSKLAETLTALANAHGGVILFGVAAGG